MDFAKNILNKFGWQDGEGLGKDKQGITKPIKASLKFDQAGLGTDASTEFNNNWWDRVFNDAAQNVTIRQNDNGIINLDLKDKEKSVEVSTKSYSVKKLSESGNGIYCNHFMTADVAASDTFAVTNYKALSDEELFKACGGRTAHKGARHGLKLSGKLARLEKQEKELLAKMQARVNGAKNHYSFEESSKKLNEKPSKNKIMELKTVCQQNEESKEILTVKNKKKKQKAQLNEDTLAIDTIQNNKYSCEKPSNEKKMKNKYADLEFAKDCQQKEHSGEADLMLKKKKKKQKGNLTMSNETLLTKNELTIKSTEDKNLSLEKISKKQKKKSKKQDEQLELSVQKEDSDEITSTLKQKKDKKNVATSNETHATEDTCPARSIKKKKRKALSVDSCEEPISLKSKKPKSS